MPAPQTAQPSHVARNARPPLGPGLGVGGRLGRWTAPTGGTCTQVGVSSLYENQRPLRGGVPVGLMLATVSSSKSLSTSPGSRVEPALPPKPPAPPCPALPECPAGPPPALPAMPPAMPPALPAMPPALPAMPAPALPAMPAPALPAAPPRPVVPAAPPPPDFPPAPPPAPASTPPLTC